MVFEPRLNGFVFLLGVRALGDVFARQMYSVGVTLGQGRPPVLFNRASPIALLFEGGSPGNLRIAIVCLVRLISRGLPYIGARH